MSLLPWLQKTFNRTGNQLLLLASLVTGETLVEVFVRWEENKGLPSWERYALAAGFLVLRILYPKKERQVLEAGRVIEREHRDTRESVKKEEANGR